MKFRKGFLLLVFSFLSFYVKSQQYPIKYYTTADGLPHSQVTHIFQDSRGNMWFSTPAGGLSCFNGSRFKNYGQREGLSNLVVRACTEDKNGRMVIGTMGSGIFFLENDTVVQYTNKELSTDVFAIHTDPSGTVWIGTGLGLFSLSDGKLTNFTKDNGLEAYAVTSINSDENGNLWFLYDEAYGLYRWKENSLVKFDASNGLTNGRLLNTYHDGKGNTWVAAFDGVYQIAKNAKVAKKINHPGLPKYYVFDFAQVNEQTIYMCSQDKGITVFDLATGKISYINSNHGLKSDLVFRIFRDRENNLWFSNWGDGISRLHLSGFKQYASKEGIENRIVYQANEINNTVLVATSKGLLEKKGNTWEPYVKSISGNVVCFYDAGEFIWCAGENELLRIKKSDRQVKKYPVPYIKSITQSGNGKLFFGSWGGGLQELAGDKIQAVNDTIAKEAYYYCAFTDADGNCWFGTFNSGIVHYNAKTNQFKRLTGKEGLPSNIIVSITQDKQGNIWAGTSGAGIAIVDKKLKVDQVLTVNHGLKANAVNSLVSDNGNGIWVGQVGCLSHIVPGEKGKFEVMPYGIDDGFTGDCMNGSLCVDGKGRLWIPTNNFLWCYDEKEKIPGNDVLDIYLSNVFCDFNSISLEQHQNFSHRQNRFTFHFYTTHMARNNQVQFRYRLVGLDQEFSPPTNLSEVTYHDLRPGVYAFEVMACLNNNCTEKKLSWSFEITPPFWQTWWFRISVVSCLLLVVWVVFRWRTAQLRRHKLMLEKQVRERTQEIKNQRDEIKTQKEMIEQKQKEVVDSIQYAKRIQDALLPNEKYVDKNIKRLKKS